MKQGLTKQQVNQKIKQGEINTNIEKPTRSFRQIISSNIFTYFNAVNVVLFCFVLLTGRMRNGLFIGTVVLNACIGIFQQIRSKLLLDKLSILVQNKVQVLRDEKWIEIAADEIVTEDFIHMYAGQQIPIDGVFEEGNIEVDESMLTGESKHIRKYKNCDVYAGSIITSGDGYIRVCKVGAQCAIHQIIEDAKKEVYAQSVLHEDLERIIRIVSIMIIPAGILLYLTQYYFIGLAWRDALLKTIAALVGMIPEGLVVLTSIALAISSIRLAKKRVLVQDLFSIESLARVNIACFDKTGILTTGEMYVENVDILDQQYKNTFSSILSSYVASQTNLNVTGVALQNYFQDIPKYRYLDVLPFSSERKYACATLEEVGTIYVGAYTYLFSKQDEEIQKRIQIYTQQGKRVLVVAVAKQVQTLETLPEDLHCIAYIVLCDTLRPNAKKIIDYFKNQNVKVCILSGDDAQTVASLARFAKVENASACIDMHNATDAIENLVHQYCIFGRVKPEEKKYIVQALQKQGNHVLMIGDGVNDVPALKCADVSVSIAQGSEAAKNNANIVLLNNDFGEIPKIIDEGRRVINNISLAASMYLVKTIFSVLLTLYVICFHEPYPFLPIHLTLISAIGVGIPTFILQLEPCFNRVQDNFVKKAFLRALPSSLTVFISAFILCVLKRQYAITDARFYGIFVLLTGYVYILTLLHVYQPMSKLRAIVISCMFIGLVAIVTLFSSFIHVSFTIHDSIWIGIGFLVEPFILGILRNIQRKIVYEKL